MEDADSCPSDCDPSDPSDPSDPERSICGDSICQEDESNDLCPADCEVIDPQVYEEPPDPNAELTGYFDGVFQRDGEWIVQGWACHLGWGPSINVEIYVGGDSSSGVFVKRALTDDEQASPIGDACGTQEGQHRFHIPLTDEELTLYAGQAIYIHGISPIGNGDHLLTNSGTFFVPSADDGHEDLPFDLNQVTWLHTNVSNWPVTSTLSVNFQGESICLDYDQRDVWPPVTIPHGSGMGTVDVVSNPWVFIQYDGQWFAATWEWMRPGSICKNKSSVAGDHIKQPPFRSINWRPTSGERLYFMVSSLARIPTITNVQERTPIVEVIWP